jgi:hypothetical protein
MIKVSEGVSKVQGSDLVISAVPGEFYAYSAEITGERPLYALMKCKANKARPLATISDLGREANLLFLFGDLKQVQICAVEAAQTFGLLGDDASSTSFDKTWVAPAGITVEHFDEIRSRKDVAELVKICQTACSGRETSLMLESNSVIAVMTDAGKYGLFFAREITPAAVPIEACHILL